MSKAVKKVRGVPGGPEFVVGKGPVPPRVVPLRGPRGSIYPLDKIQPGEYFDIPVPDAAKAAQKRSYLSALSKARGIKAETRYLVEEGIVRCWHRGTRAVQGELLLELAGEEE
jgi:hypothetical protein